MLLDEPTSAKNILLDAQKRSSRIQVVMGHRATPISRLPEEVIEKFLHAITTSHECSIVGFVGPPSRLGNCFVMGHRATQCCMVTRKPPHSNHNKTAASACSETRQRTLVLVDICRGLKKRSDASFLGDSILCLCWFFSFRRRGFSWLLNWLRLHLD